MFKDKTSKKRFHNVDNKDLSTLDAMHNKIINGYSTKIIEEKNNLNKIEELEIKFTNINDLISQYNINNIKNEKYYNELWNSNIKIKEEIIKIKENLSDINNFNDLKKKDVTILKISFDKIKLLDAELDGVEP
jgi:hypothetical protein